MLEFVRQLYSHLTSSCSNVYHLVKQASLLRVETIYEIIGGLGVNRPECAVLERMVVVNCQFL